MKVLNILLLGLFVTYQLFAQSNNSNIEGIYKSLTKSPIEFTTIDSMTYNEEEGYDLYKIPTQPEVIFFRATCMNPGPPYSYDKIRIGCKEYKMESLFFEKENQFKIDKEEPVRFNYTGCYVFDFNHNQYTCIYFMDSQKPSSTPNFFIVLLNLSKPDNRPILLSEQASFNPVCFGDFNNDGILDYADWRYGSLYEPTMYFYSLINNTFKKNKKYFVKIEYDEHLEEYYINKEKSIWFEFYK